MNIQNTDKGRSYLTHIGERTKSGEKGFKTLWAPAGMALSLLDLTFNDKDAGWISKKSMIHYLQHNVEKIDLDPSDLDQITNLSEKSKAKEVSLLFKKVKGLGGDQPKEFSTISHYNLVKIMNLFGYPAMIKENKFGVCFGFSKMWEQAATLGPIEEAAFFRRLKLLDGCIAYGVVSKTKCMELQNKIEKIREKAKLNPEALTEKEMDYLEIHPFLDGVYLLQNAHLEDEIFPGQKNQGFKEVIEVMESTKLKEMDGIKTVTQKAHEFNRDTLSTYLADLKEVLKHSPQATIVIALEELKIANAGLTDGSGHGVVLQYHSPSENWRYVDINYLGLKNSAFFKPLTTDELTESLFNSAKFKPEAMAKMEKSLKAEISINFANSRLNSLNVEAFQERINDLSEKSIDIPTEIQKCLIENNTERLEQLLKTNHFDVNGSFPWRGYEMTPLIFACVRQHKEAVHLLLSQEGIQVNKTAKNLSPLTIAYKYKNLEMLKDLLQHPDIDPNPIDSNGLPLIFTASFQRNPEMIRALITAGADLRAKGQGISLLHWMEKDPESSEHFIDTLKLSLTKEPSVLSTKDEFGKTILDVCYEEGRDGMPILEVMIENGIDPATIMSPQTMKTIIESFEDKKINEQLKLTIEKLISM